MSDDEGVDSTANEIAVDEYVVEDEPESEVNIGHGYASVVDGHAADTEINYSSVVDGNVAETEIDYAPLDNNVTKEDLSVPPVEGRGGCQTETRSTVFQFVSVSAGFGWNC